MCDVNDIEDLSSANARIINGITDIAPNPYYPPEPFRVECVIVCDGFHDFLARTLPTNKFLFDRLVVVTSYEEKETQRICEFHHVECVRTDDMDTRKGKFRKGKGINAGLAALSKAAWVVHMDADIYLPPQTRLLLEQAQLDPHMIYGVDRFDVKGYAAWDEFMSLPSLQHEAGTYIHPKAFPLGTRLMFNHASGWLPLGYFQLWHPRTSGIMTYPEIHETAGRTDTLHAQRWPRNMRALIPEVIAYHLDSEDKSVMDANWSGRTTSSFAHESRTWKKLP